MTNNRHYLDNKYLEKAKDGTQIWLGDILPKEPRERELFGLEYLSSVILLSACKGLIAGNCGGSDAALYFNDHGYEYYHLYDLGVYE